MVDMSTALVTIVALYRGVIGLLFILIWLTLRPHGSGLASRRLWLWSMLAGDSSDWTCGARCCAERAELATVRYTRRAWNGDVLCSLYRWPDPYLADSGLHGSNDRACHRDPFWGRGMASVASTDNRGTTENRRGVWRHRLKPLDFSEDSLS
jgi:hypothetical protein